MQSTYIVIHLSHAPRSSLISGVVIYLLRLEGPCYSCFCLDLVPDSTRRAVASRYPEEQADQLAVVGVRHADF